MEYDVVAVSSMLGSVLLKTPGTYLGGYGNNVLIAFGPTLKMIRRVDGLQVWRIEVSDGSEPMSPEEARKLWVTGRTDWSVIESIIAVKDDLLLYAYGSRGDIVAARISSGAILCRTQLSGPVASLVLRGDLVVAATRHQVHSFQLRT